MPLPEGYLPRADDVVVIHAVVKYDVKPKEDTDDDRRLKVFVRPIESYTDVRIPLDTIVEVYSRHFDPEERVRLISQPECEGVVIASHETQVWVKFDAGTSLGLRTVPATSLALESKDPIDEPFTVEEPPAMRFAVGQMVIIARAPEDPLRAEDIAPYLGQEATIFGIDGRLYKVTIAGTDFYVSDDMLDPPRAPSTIEHDGTIKF